jgi:hypothetical protein
MAIEPFATESEERISLSDLPCVGSDAGQLRRPVRQLPDSLTRERRRDGVERPETRAQA